MQINYDFLEKYTFKNKAMTLRNHVIMAPTTLRSSLEDGTVTDNELHYYQLRAQGPAMIITEAAYINEIGRGWEGGISVADDDKIPGLRRLASAIQSGGAKAILQIFAAGRQTTNAILRGETPVSASNQPYTNGDFDVPRALTHDEIVQTIEDFANATKRAILAGFDGVELHGANLYLMQQFFSADSNRRDDIWGGTTEKRQRFGLTVTAKVAQTIEKFADRPFLLGYRQSPEEPMVPGITLAESLEFAQRVTSLPIDYLHLSLKDSFQVPFKNTQDTKRVIDYYRETLPEGYPLMVAGLLKKPEQVEELMDAGVTFAALGRELIVEPNWVQKVANNDERAIRYAISPSDFDLLGVPKPLAEWLLTRFRNGFPVTTDVLFDPKQPWRYYKNAVVTVTKPIDPTKLMTLKNRP
ncbi:NADH-dependent flavin oxidoreductase [Leuconostoc rapi]|uniref:NADH-dependent flavin oxidoreductase n=1 Tax=Leuconostoc rapi TaxID=1406906 RepID=UPI001956D0EA|nr:NADH-dependent flavin oxidoreductase [Leuconostoc rapi]MBM7436448.1 2,4-dienoyl-CoA reductase-like NADH-dependent reductase (Old Yellow Enzyme family) [Leuconostoc rapi]